MPQGLGIVAAGCEAGTLHHHRNLASKQGNLGWRGVVGGRRQKTEESALSDDLARCVESPEADVVHEDRPMDIGSGPRLGNDEEFPAFQVPHEGFGQGRS